MEIRMKKFTVNRRELTCLMINLFSVKLLFTYPREIVTACGSAGWLNVIFMSLLSLVMYLITERIYRRTGMESILAAAEGIGGAGLKIIVGLILFTAVLINTAAIIRTFPECVNMVLLPNTPMEAVLLLLLAVIAAGAAIGLRAIAGIGSIFIPIGGAVLLFFLIFLTPYININNLFPLLGTDKLSAFTNPLPMLSMYSDIIVLFLIQPHCNDYGDIKKSGLRAIIISGITALLIVLMYILIYPSPISSEFIFPVYQMARIVRIGDYFYRMEAFFEFVWSLSVLLCSAFYIFLLCGIWCETFGIKYRRPLIFPVLLIVGSICFITGSMAELLEFMKRAEVIIMPAAYLLPLLIGILYRIKAASAAKYPTR